MRGSGSDGEMCEPEIVVHQNQHAGREEDGIGEFDDGEAAQVERVDDVAGDGEGGEGEGKAVDGGEQELNGDDGVDESREEFLGQNGVFLDKFGEVVEPRGDGEGQEEEASDQSQVALCSG